jgi:uncharacterized protein YkwD
VTGTVRCLTLCLTAVVTLAACGGAPERADGAGGSSSVGTSAPSAATTTATLTATLTASTTRPSVAPSTTPATTRPKPTATTRPTTTPKPSPKPSPKPAPKPAPKPPSSGGVAGQVLSLVNSERAKAGCRAVRASAALQSAAQAHSGDMAAHDYFSHTSRDGRTFADRIRAAGYRGSTIGENIAAGQSTAAAVMRSWMASPGHRANILNCSFTALGVGHATGGSYGHYWTQDFGG